MYWRSVHKTKPPDCHYFERMDPNFYVVGTISPQKICLWSIHILVSLLSIFVGSEVRDWSRSPTTCTLTLFWLVGFSVVKHFPKNQWSISISIQLNLIIFGILNDSVPTLNLIQCNLIFQNQSGYFNSLF